MLKRSSFLLVFCVLWFAIISSSGEVHGEEDVWGAGGPLVKKEKRTTLVTTEYGEISAVRVKDNINGSYLLHFFILEPNSLFLPVLLHADMIFYVHTGSGKISWTEEGDLESTELSRGDIYTLKQGSVFFMQSNLETETERQKLRIHAIFANLHNGLQGPITGPYSSIRDMIIGFDRKVLQAAFKVPQDVIDELLNGTEQPAIIHGVSKTKGLRSWEKEVEFVRGLLRSRSYNIFELNKKKKKSGARAYNLFKEGKDFENKNGWSTTVTRKKLSALKGSNIGVFMVNLTAGSMMGPHWNPMASEIGVVLQGRGMVRTVCSSISNETGCSNMRFEVEEGDVFVVSRFHPMAQMAFNNGTFVFMGFSTSTKRNHPQFLAGQASVFRTLDRDVLAMSFNVTNTTLDQLLGAEGESVILSCVSCAEEELSVMEEEIEREREEAREREEEAARKREEEEARRQEEEKRRQEEEEERKRQEEEERRREEEGAKKEEEERRRREEEEEEEAARREEEEKRRQEEEEEEERKRREEAAARREEEEARKKEEARQREEEQEQEQEEERRKEKEEAARREEEEARRKEEEGRKRAQEQEEERRREQEAAARREEEAARRKEKEVRKRQQEQEEERRREEEVARQREEDEEEARREQEARQIEQEQEEERRREEAARQEEAEAAARRQEEERRRVEQEQEEARREEEARMGEKERREEEERHGGKSEEERAAEEERRMEEAAQREQEAARQRRRKREEEEEEEQGGENEATTGKWEMIPTTVV